MASPEKPTDIRPFRHMTPLHATVQRVMKRTVDLNDDEASRQFESRVMEGLSEAQARSEEDQSEL